MRLATVLTAALTIVMAGAATFALAGDSANPIGPWLTEDGSAIVQVAACGPALCGRIIWSQKPVDAKGRPLCGRAILGEAMKASANSWSKGWIYSPRMDSRYPVVLTLLANGMLRVHVSAGLFGKDQAWTRPPQAVTPCTP
jgi:uncharacterized protein (DUF2147 family)